VQRYEKKANSNYLAEKKAATKKKETEKIVCLEKND
jgi:hypothetical protein